jgi:putative endonuclease
LAKHQQTGQTGEAMAVQYLLPKGFTILHQNWRYSRYEIDIIAFKEKVLHFIEVKTRTSHQFGLPEESVSLKKIKNMMHAAEAFQWQYPQWKKIQYNVLAITINADGLADYYFIDDVYL